MSASEPLLPLRAPSPVQPSALSSVLPSKRKAFIALLTVFIVCELTIVSMNGATFNKAW